MDGDSFFYRGRSGVAAISKGIPIFWRHHNWKLKIARSKRS